MRTGRTFGATQTRPIASFVVGLLTLSIGLRAQSATDFGLPEGSVVIERAAIPKTIHKDRELLLWMLSPQKHDRGEFSQSNPYMCPERTLGSYYSGPTRISLVDTNSKSTINTITIRQTFSAEDSFDVPYRILSDYLYLVPGHPKGSDEVQLKHKGSAQTETLKWIDYLFSETPTRPGRWSFQIDYRGRRGALDSYNVRYDPSREKFFGTLTSVAPPEELR
jgi:hypothetical protein